MGFFGSLGAAAKRFATPDNLMMIGAALKDASAGGSDNFMGVQQAMLQRRQLAMKQEAQQRLSGLFGGQRSTVPMADEGGFAAAQPVPPRVSDMVEAAMMGGPGPSLEQVTARPQPRVPQMQQQDQIPSLSDPNVQRELLAAEQAGVNIGPIIQMLQGGAPDIAIGPDGRPYSKKDASVLGQRFGAPEVVNGLVIDKNDPNNIERHIPQLGEGMTYQRDASGRAIGVGNANGYVDALGASTEAKQLGQTRGTMLNVPVSSGGTAMMTGGQYLGGAQGSQLGGGRLGMTQTPQDAAYGSNLATAAAERYKGLQTAGQSAPQKISRLKQIEGLLGDYEGGKFGPTGVELASALNSLGFKMDKRMSNAQAADAIGNQLVLDLNGGSLGTGFSNADRSFLEKTVPGLRQSSGGRKQLINIGVATYQRQADIANKARQWQSRFGRIDAPDATGKTFEDYLQAWSETNPVFGQ